MPMDLTEVLAKHTEALQERQLALQDNVNDVASSIKTLEGLMKGGWAEAKHRMQAQDERQKAVEKVRAEQQLCLAAAQAAGTVPDR